MLKSMELKYKKSPEEKKPICLFFRVLLDVRLALRPFNLSGSEAARSRPLDIRDVCDDDDDDD